MDKSRQNYKYKNERFKNKLAKSSINSVFIQNMHTVLVRGKIKGIYFCIKLYVVLITGFSILRATICVKV